MNLLIAVPIVLGFCLVAVGSIILIGLAIVSLVLARTVDNAGFISDIEE